MPNAGRRTPCEGLPFKLRDGTKSAATYASPGTKHDRSAAVAVPLRNKIVIRHQILRGRYKSGYDFICTRSLRVIGHKRCIYAANLNLSSRKPSAVKLDSF